LIMSTGPTLAMPDLGRAAPATTGGTAGTLEEVERAHILRIVEACRWKLSGPGNAADRLGLNRSTLQFRMRKLGIARPPTTRPNFNAAVRQEETRSAAEREVAPGRRRTLSADE